jgi:hypothetical protein
MIKVSKKLEIERLYVNITKTIYKKSIGNIVLNVESLKHFL